MSSSPQAARSQGHPSPAPSHSTTATFGNAGGSNAPPSKSGPALRPPNSYNNMQRSSSHNTNYSNRSKSSGPAKTNGANAQDAPLIIQGPSGRIACVADIRGNISMLNQIAAETGAQAIIHTGDFGFYERQSFERISDRTLRHLVQYSSLVPPTLRAKMLGTDPPRGPASAEKANVSTNLRQQVLDYPEPLLSEFSHLLSGKIKLDVPVFTVWGACEDVAVLERLRTGEYQIPNLFVLDEATTKAIDVGGVRLRLFGLGGAVVLHKLFDNGEGAATIAGGAGTMWTTALQIGELVDTAQKHYDPTETRLLVTHASPGREGLLAQLALAIKADLTVSAGLHFRYGVSYNEFSVQHDPENYRNKLDHAKKQFGEIWDTVKSQVEAVIDDQQRILLNHALAVANRIPASATATGAANDEPAWKNTWNWNLPDAAYGNLVLAVKDGRVSAETKSQGFNFAYRRSNQPASLTASVPSGIKAESSATNPTSPKASNVARFPSSPAASAATAMAAVSAASTASRFETTAHATASFGAGAAATEFHNNNNRSGPPTPLIRRERERKPRERGHESGASRSDMDGGMTSGAESSATSRRFRNPWTLYVSQLKEALPVSESDLRGYFGPAATGITSVKLVYERERFAHRRGASSSGKEDEPTKPTEKRQRPFAYVEFRDQEAMNQALQRQGETIKSSQVKPALEVADSSKSVLANSKKEEATPIEETVTTTIMDNKKKPIEPFTRVYFGWDDDDDQPTSTTTTPPITHNNNNNRGKKIGKSPKPNNNHSKKNQSSEVSSQQQQQQNGESIGAGEGGV